VECPYRLERGAASWHNRLPLEKSMTDLALTDDLFFTKTGMDQARVEKIVAEALQGMDDGELFLE